MTSRMTTTTTFDEIHRFIDLLLDEGEKLGRESDEAEADLKRVLEEIIRRIEEMDS